MRLGGHEPLERQQVTRGVPRQVPPQPCPPCEYTFVSAPRERMLVRIGGVRVSTIDEAVQLKLRAQRGSEDALALWRKLWAAYADGGPEAAAELVEKLVAVPADDEEDGR